MPKAPSILLINPWITDFAAYDYWTKPLGLLLLGALLREGGCGVAFIDCLDRYDPSGTRDPDLIAGVDRRYGTGKYPRMRIPKPAVYADVPRHYHRYGIHPDSLLRQLKASEQPDLIWVTSMMTYWYPGVQQTIRVIREVFPETPVWLGGIYARLCAEHARRTSGAHDIITGSQESLPDKIAAATGFCLRNRRAWAHFEASPLAGMGSALPTHLRAAADQPGMYFQVSVLCCGNAPAGMAKAKRRGDLWGNPEMASRFRRGGFCLL